MPLRGSVFVLKELLSAASPALFNFQAIFLLPTYNAQSFGETYQKYRKLILFSFYYAISAFYKNRLYL